VTSTVNLATFRGVEEDLFALTAFLVDQPSESFHESALADWIEQQLEPFDHLVVTRIGDNVVARTELGRDRRVILAGHTDTVPANNNGSARIEGKVLHGLGAVDMKGGLAVMLAVAVTVPEPVHDLTFVFYAREEVARAHSGLGELIELAPELVAGDCAVLGEPTGAVIEAGCQGALRFEVALAGQRAHTARPWMGVNAVHRLGPILEKLAQWPARQPTIDGCTYHESLQAVAIEGGVSGNVVPDAAMVRVHHRFAPDRDLAAAETFVRDFVAEHLEDGDQVTVVDAAASCPPDLSHPLIAQLVADNQLAVRAKLGWTDVARFAELGIPAVNFGPGDPTMAHTKDEHVHASEISRCYDALVSLVADAGGVVGS